MSKKVKSDGGASSYYTFTLPGIGKFETEELIREFVNNDFDLGTILKCLKRLAELHKGGGKEGNDELYEWNKIKYIADKEIKRIRDGYRRRQIFYNQAGVNIKEASHTPENTPPLRPHEIDSDPQYITQPTIDPAISNAKQSNWNGKK